MKVEHIANSNETSFFDRLKDFVANPDIEVIDVKYSTTTIDGFDENVEYAALVLYEDKYPTKSQLQSDYDDLVKVHNDLTDMIHAKKGDTKAIYDAVNKAVMSSFKNKLEKNDLKEQLFDLQEVFGNIAEHPIPLDEIQKQAEIGLSIVNKMVEGLGHEPEGATP